MQRYPLFENLRAKPPLQKMELSPLFTTDTKTVPVSPLFAVDTNLKDLKSFVINLIQERGGGGGILLPRGQTKVVRSLVDPARAKLSEPVERRAVDQ